MAVAPMEDNVMILGDDEEGSPQPSCSATTSSSGHQAKNVSPLKSQLPVRAHITQSSFASAKKDKNVVQAENQKLFAEFVEHCSPLTEDCPEVLTFLQTKHDKADPDYLSSVEFRNTLGRCLTHAQAKKSKTFVYIRELCTELKQHAAKRRQRLIKADSSTSASGTFPSASVSLKSKDKTKGKVDQEENGMESAAEEQPSTSGLQANNEDEAQEEERKAKRASRKQIAYLENLLMVYNDEIQRLQQAELSLDELGAEDSTYIQEHKLKRKMMKIYEKLCELKGCNTLTGRAIEQRIAYSGTQYPEINRKIECFINSPAARSDPPDYLDILHQVSQANECHNLCLSKKQLTQIAEEAFTETWKRLRKRRHQDMIYNFGSHLTDNYSIDLDPAKNDATLLGKLGSNREQALKNLDEVITKYAVKQDEEEQERCRRLEKGSKGKEDCKLEKKAETKTNMVAAQEKEDDDEEEEEEKENDDEDDESSDPDIEEEIQASTQQDGPDDDDDDDGNEAEQACEGDNKADQTYNQTGSVSAGEDRSLKDDDEPVTSGSPISNDTKSQTSCLSEILSRRDSPSQSELTQTDDQQLLPNGNPEKLQEPVDSSNQVSAVLVRTNKVTKDPPDVTSAVANGEPQNGAGESLPSLQTVTLQHCDAQTTDGTSPSPSSRTTRSQKRKRVEMMFDDSRNTKYIIISESETDIPLDMAVISCSSLQEVESTRADTPTQDLVSSSQLTPPPKKNKVNVATQCDPDEIIVLSDSE